MLLAGFTRVAAISILAPYQPFNGDIIRELNPHRLFSFTVARQSLLLVLFGIVVMDSLW